PRRAWGFASRRPRGLLLLQAEPRELLLEPRQAAATVHQLLLTAGPGRMRLRVDVEMQHVALLAPGGAGGEFAAVGHLDRHGVVVRMRMGLHRRCPAAKAAVKYRR